MCAVRLCVGKVSATMRRTLASGAIVLLLSCLPKAALAGCTCGCGIESCNPGSCSWKTCSAANCGGTCTGSGTCGWCSHEGSPQCGGETTRCGDEGSGGCGQGNACYLNCWTRYCATLQVPDCNKHEGTCGCGCKGWGCIAPGETCDCGYDEENPPPNCSTAGGNRCGGSDCACGLVCPDGLSGNPCGGKGCKTSCGGSGCAGSACDNRCKASSTHCGGKGCKINCQGSWCSYYPGGGCSGLCKLSTSQCSGKCSSCTNLRPGGAGCPRCANSCNCGGNGICTRNMLTQCTQPGQNACESDGQSYCRLSSCCAQGCSWSGCVLFNPQCTPQLAIWCTCPNALCYCPS